MPPFASREPLYGRQKASWRLDCLSQRTSDSESTNGIPNAELLRCGRLRRSVALMIESEIRQRPLALSRRNNNFRAVCCSGIEDLDRAVGDFCREAFNLIHLIDEAKSSPPSAACPSVMTSARIMPDRSIPRLGGSSPHLTYFVLSDVLRTGLMGPTLSSNRASWR